MATRWEPDTHPNVKLDFEGLDENGDPANCTRAEVDGIELFGADAAAVMAAVLAENRLKNRAIGVVLDALPAEMKKPVLDSDGDPTGDFVVKDKHAPEWAFGQPDGRLSVTVPNAPAEVLATIAAALAAQFGEAVTLES